MAAHDLDRNLKRASGGTLFAEPDALDLSISWLKDGVKIPTSAIHSVVVLDADAPAHPDLSGLQRIPKVLWLRTALSQRAGLVLVFSTPFLIREFKYGAEQGLPISKKERRNGVAVDVLMLDLPTLDAAEHAAADIRAKRSPNVASALAPLIPSATDSERSQHRRTGRFAMAQLMGILVLQLTIAAGAFAVLPQRTGKPTPFDWTPVLRNVVIAWLGLAAGWALGRAAGPMKFKWLRFVPFAVLPLIVLMVVPATHTGGALAFAGLYGVVIGWLLMTLSGRSPR